MDKRIPTKRREGKRLIDYHQRVGVRRGLQTAIIDALEAREIDVDASSRERIIACDDDDTLRAWLRRAVRVERIDEVFDD